MSLRLRIVLLILLLVASVAVTLSALQLRTLVDSLSNAAVERAELAGTQVSSFLIDRISQRSLDYHPPKADAPFITTAAQLIAGSSSTEIPHELTTLERTKLMWYDIASTDPAMQLFLQKSMASSKTLIEINVADDKDQILVSSNPPSVGTQIQRREKFSSWKELPWYRRAYGLVTRRPDWEISPRPIGLANQGEGLLQIQVVSSSVLVRESLLPQVQQLAFISGSAVLLSLILTLLATHRILRPLYRIEQTIDRIAQGSFQAADEKDSHLAKEFRAVESKLNLLGQQFRGARVGDVPVPVAPKTLEGMVEHVATQLDVATRLAAISRLSGGVAHEIKNPLNAILLRLDLLKARLGDTDEDVTKEFEVLSKEVLRLDRVVKTFLDFSRPLEVHFEEVDLALLVKEVTDLIQPQAAASNVKLDCEIPSAEHGDGCTMRGDPDLLKQAVLNLVTNAVEAMGKTGGWLRVSVSRAPGKLILQVADNGPGIPANMRDKVFQLYFTTKTRGSGIGLAMTYRATQLHNGTISFSSENVAGEKERGTVFHLEFPATEPHV